MGWRGSIRRGSGVVLREVVSRGEAVLGTEIELERLVARDLNAQAPDRTAGDAVGELVAARGDLRKLEAALLVRSAHVLSSGRRRALDTLEEELQPCRLDRAIGPVHLSAQAARTRCAVVDRCRVPRVAHAATLGEPAPRCLGLFRAGAGVREDPLELLLRRVAQVEVRVRDREIVVQLEAPRLLAERLAEEWSRGRPVPSLERGSGECGNVNDYGRGRRRRRRGAAAARQRERESDGEAERFHSTHVGPVPQFLKRRCASSAARWLWGPAPAVAYSLRVWIRTCRLRTALAVTVRSPFVSRHQSRRASTPGVMTVVVPPDVRSRLVPVRPYWTGVPEASANVILDAPPPDGIGPVPHPAPSVVTPCAERSSPVSASRAQRALCCVSTRAAPVMYANCPCC